MNPFIEDYDNSGLEKALEPCYSKCGLPISVCVTWKLGRNANLGPTPGLLNLNAYFNIPPLPSNVCTLKVLLVSDISGTSLVTSLAIKCLEFRNNQNLEILCLEFRNNS